jgi:hypothetical protein
LFSPWHEPILAPMANGCSNGNNSFIKEDPWRIFRIMAG